jgi:two-component system NtrC family sensor kinase
MLYDSEKMPVGGVQTFRDITAEKKRHEMYCHTEKLAAIGQLAAGVAHEINNPLSNIIGYARLIKPGAKGKEIDKRVAVIVEQARKCSEIVKGLLDYSRSSGAEPNEFVLSALIEKVIAMVRYQAEKQGTRIDFKPSGEYSVYADAGKIEQVIFNLLLNALQTTPRARNIWVTTGRAGKNIYFSIADNGPGVEPEMHQKIFDPFYTTKPISQGTGLGLSICAGIVAEADGSIDIETRDGGGVVFTVLLPEKENIV